MKIEVQGLSFHYNSVPVLENISLVLEPRKVTCVIGPNGAGKTTLLKVIASILSPSKGAVYIDGKDCKLYDPKELARLIAYEEPYISRDLPMTVLDFLLTARYPYHKILRYFESIEDLEIVDAVAKDLNISHLLSRRLDQLSSGELQRVIISHALIKKPSVLLLDEPSAFLDIRYRFEILDYVKKYTAKEGLVTVVAIHDLHLASMYCDLVVVMDRGRIVYSGSPLEVFTSGIVEKVYGIEIDLVKLSDEKLVVVPKPRRDFLG
ncbi:MAG: ABC transporter ATP-binding protein [Ignisphaera sp.]